MSHTTRYLLGALALGLLTLVAAGCRAPGASPSGSPPVTTSPGSPAPDFSLVSLDGDAYSLADLKGKPIVLNFWSSTCPHCATVAPYLQDLHTQHADQGLVVLGVAGLDSETALRDKASSLKITYPIAISPDTGRAYDVARIPLTYFIDREGNISESIRGAQPRGQFEDAAQKIL
ncbi:MAG: TlpA family protein disulfide reductase [Armatimonadota bacterium]|nr:MAG: TlpA family protein disulfide reductase [Armatimonadota bacterium]